MSTPAVPVRNALELDTLNRDWYLDVNTGTDAAPVWTGVFGITEFNGAITPTTQDSSDFDSGGYKSNTVTALEWSCTGKLRRARDVSTPDEYDPGQEFIRLHSLEQGGANKVDIRFYEMTEDGPRVEAYRGRASVTWSPDGGGMDALSMVSFTLQGSGRRQVITHPDA